MASNRFRMWEAMTLSATFDRIGNEEIGLWLEGIDGLPGFGNAVTNASFQTSWKMFVFMILFIRAVNGLEIIGAKALNMKDVICAMPPFLLVGKEFSCFMISVICIGVIVILKPFLLLVQASLVEGVVCLFIIILLLALLY